MTLIGTFDPVLETVPSTVGAYPNSTNLIPDSNFELGSGNPFAVGNDYDGLRVTDLGYAGEASYRLTVDTTNLGNDASFYDTFTLTQEMIDNGFRFSYRLYVPVASPFIGKRVGHRFARLSTGGGSFTIMSQQLTQGWNQLVLSASNSWLTSGFWNTYYSPLTAGATVDVSLATVYATASGGPADSARTDGNSGAQLWVDQMLFKVGTTLHDWEPYDGEPFYTEGQQWVATDDGTFQGLTVTKYDLITCTSSGYLTADEASWEVTPIIGSIAESLQVKPFAGHGVPIGLGDWRVAVEILLPIDSTSRWGIAKWGESQWNGLGWYDLTDWVRGCEWTRGTEEFGGRPEVGVATVTLENLDRKFSPWNGVSAFQDATVVDDTGAVRPGYLGPGTIMRVVAHSPSGMIEPYTDPGGIPDTILDEFTAALNTSLWTSAGSASTTGGDLSIPSGSSVQTDAIFPADGLTVTWRIDTVSAFTFLSVGETEIGPTLLDAGGGWEFYDGVSSYTSFTAAGNYLRIRQIGDTAYFESSSDGISWTTHGSVSGFPTANTDVRSASFSGTLKVESIQIDYTSAGTLLPASPDSWVPQITGIVESWVDDTDGGGADASVTVTFVETLSAMAKVDKPALVSVVGNDDLPEVRLQRLLDAAGWQYGDVDSISWAMDLSPSSNYNLQSTDMANNRISELYLTVDSVGGVIRSDRSGKPLFYRQDGDGGVGVHINRGPESTYFEGLSWQYETGSPSTYFKVPYVTDSVSVANDDEPIENTISLTYVGGTERTGTDNISVQQYDQRTYTRSDLICKTNDMLDHLIARRLEHRANRPLRLESCSLHSSHERALVPIIGLDIGAYTNVNLPSFDGYTVSVGSAYIQGLTHRLTPLNGAEVIWTCDVTFGIQGSISMEVTP